MSKRIGITQAQRVISLFGGARKLSRLMPHFDPSRIYRWTYEPPAGTGGLVPSTAWAELFEAAERIGVNLTNDHFDPRVFVTEVADDDEIFC